MSLNKLVGGDCGGNNALVQLSNIVGRDASLTQQNSQSNQYINEFLSQNIPVHQTFNMNSLLNNMPDVEKTFERTPETSNMAMMGTSKSIPWAGGPSTSFVHQQSMLRPYNVPFQPLVHNQRPTNFQIEYLEEDNIADSDVKAKAQEYVNTMNDDDDYAYNQFMSFMKRISSSELNLGDNNVPNEQNNLSKEDLINQMSEKYKDEWAKLSNVTDYWDSETANGISEEYMFTEGNVMLENKSSLEIGKEKLRLGDIPGAVLCFEAAVQQQPESAEAWFLLGTTQAENEQDPLAITALKKSLTINPTQLEAYITLAAAYTNENMPKFAFASLVSWLSASPKYSDLLPQDVDHKSLGIKELENFVKSLYLKAAQLDPLNIDPDVQNALGVVFNISQEYDKAVDCFKTALMVSNNNSKLWNRLGATLANSERSEEAVEAYHEALNLEPGFIRARYNVGITCMNLGAYRQAAEHFLVALNQQYKAKTLYPNSTSVDTSSSTIWSTLRMVCSFMGEHEIAKFVDERKLSDINKFFDMDQQ